MTRHREFVLPRGTRLGVRFRPAAAAMLRVAPAELIDRVIAAEDAWGASARTLHQRLTDCRSSEEQIETLAAAFASHVREHAVQKAVRAIENCGGRADMDELARASGASSRHLRRICVEQTGLGPKALSRIVRFRRAVAAIQRGLTMTWAQAAVDFGYYDQAHMIGEFQRLAGCTPAELVRFFQSSGGDAR